MSRTISEMRNMGPACQKWLGAAEIYTEADLREYGAVEAYHRANFFAQQRPHLMFLYALEAALLDIPLGVLSPEDRARLKREAAD